MPIYLYQCDSCGLRFEKMQRMSDDPLTECPECNGHVHRVIQPVGIIFKGSGFYVTDNRSGSPTTLSGEKETSAAKEKSAAKGAKQTDTDSAESKSSSPSSTD